MAVSLALGVFSVPYFRSHCMCCVARDAFHTDILRILRIQAYFFFFGVMSESCQERDKEEATDNQHQLLNQNLYRKGVMYALQELSRFTRRGSRTSRSSPIYVLVVCCANRSNDGHDSFHPTQRLAVSCPSSRQAHVPDDVQFHDTLPTEYRDTKQRRPGRRGGGSNLWAGGRGRLDRIL